MRSMSAMHKGMMCHKQNTSQQVHILGWKSLLSVPLDHHSMRSDIWQLSYMWTQCSIHPTHKFVAAATSGNITDTDIHHIRRNVFHMDGINSHIKQVVVEHLQKLFSGLILTVSVMGFIRNVRTDHWSVCFCNSITWCYLLENITSCYSWD